MAPKHHHMPLSGGDRKALKKELSKSRAMTHIFAERSAEKRREGEALIREADNLAVNLGTNACGRTAAPSIRSPTIDQAINGGFPWLEIECSRCKTPRDVDLAALPPRADDMRARSRRAVGLPEVQEGWEAPGGDVAPANTARTD